VKSRACHKLRAKNRLVEDRETEFVCRRIVPEVTRNWEAGYKKEGYQNQHFSSQDNAA
jgi:hypothetical protein